jgi:hypothetical protein
MSMDDFIRQKIKQKNSVHYSTRFAVLMRKIRETTSLEFWVCIRPWLELLRFLEHFFLTMNEIRRKYSKVPPDSPWKNEVISMC